MFAAAAVACGDDETGGGTGGGTTTATGSTATGTTASSSSGMSGGGGHCGQDLAAAMCAGDCAFELATIDCATACTNIATVCANNACDENCQGQQTDMTLCVAGCQGSAGFHCSNLVFGCYQQNDVCTDVGQCVQDNATTGL
jgi:hypothetical protein